MVPLGRHAVRADAYALETGCCETLHPLGPAAVRVQVEGAAGRALAHEAAGALDDARLEQRLALASLAEARDGHLGAIEMGDGDFTQFLGRRDNLDALVARREQIVRLERYAPPAIRVAKRSDGHAHLPAAGEEVFRRKTVELTRAARKVGDHPVFGVGFAHLLDSLGEARVVVFLGLPARAVIHPHGGAYECPAFLIEAQRGVGPQGERLRAGFSLGEGEQGAHPPGRGKRAGGL